MLVSVFENEGVIEYAIGGKALIYKFLSAEPVRVLALTSLTEEGLAILPYVKSQVQPLQAGRFEVILAELRSMAEAIQK